MILGWLEKTFHIIKHDDEHTGHSTCDRGSITFSDMMLDCGLEKFGLSRSQYSWINGRTNS